MCFIDEVEDTVTRRPWTCLIVTLFVIALVMAAGAGIAYRQHRLSVATTMSNCR